jgi:hypothetical protein
LKSTNESPAGRYNAGPGAARKNGSESEKAVKTDTWTLTHAMEAKISDCDMLLKSLANVRNRTKQRAMSLEAMDGGSGVRSSATQRSSTASSARQRTQTDEGLRWIRRAIAPPNYGKKVSLIRTPVFQSRASADCRESAWRISRNCPTRLPHSAEIRRRLRLPVSFVFAPDETHPSRSPPANAPSIDTLHALRINSVSSEAYHGDRYFNSQGVRVVGHERTWPTANRLLRQFGRLHRTVRQEDIVIDDCRRPRNHKIFNA